MSNTQTTHHKCGTSNCPNAAEFYAAWPGQPMKFCGPCLERAKGIADVMGFKLAWARINKPAAPTVSPAPTDPSAV